MDPSNVSCKKSGDTSSLLQDVQSAIGNIQITGYAYGIYDTRCRATSSSGESIQSAYEASEYESIANSTITDDTHYYSTRSAGDGTISPPEMFKSIISSPSRVESPSTPNSVSSASSTSDDDLPDILQGVKKNIDNLSRSLENAQWNTKLELAPLESSQSTPIKSNAGSINIPYPKPLTDQDVAIRTPSKKKMLGAQTVHDMVVEQYEDTYKRLLQKLKKLSLTAEENRFRKVIAQLETMFEKNSNSSRILRNVASAKMRSSDSEGRHVGIPQSGDHNDDIKEASYKKFVAQAPLDKVIAPEVVQVFTSKTEIYQEACSGSDSAEYDEHQFIQTAIGEELLRDASSNEYLFPPTASIDTDDVSALLSSRSALVPLLKRRKCRKIGRSLITILTNSDYEPATESIQTHSTPDLINEPFRYSYASYEDVTNLGIEIYSDEGKMLIKKHIYINETIIEQTEKMLKYGLRKQSRFIGSYVHLEGERILLVSKMRRQVLLNYLYRIPEPTDEALARVTIENLRCILKPREDQSPAQQYFVCILQHKTTVYSTKIAAPNKLSWVDFGGFFIFENVSNSFNIKIQLYSINIPRGTSRCLPFFKCSQKLPSMELAGEVHIGMLNVKNRKFTFKNGANDKSKEHKLSASVEALANWPDDLKGFVTIGTSKFDHQPVWTRRWCVLEGSKLNYYNYPSDEIFCHPVGVIDLESCFSCHEASQKYLGQKVLRLIFQDSEDFKRILLSPDTAEEYNSWSKHLEIVLRLIKEWNVLK